MYDVKIEWLIADRAILIEPVGDFEASTGIRVLSELKDYLDQAIYPIHIVVSLVRVRTSVKDPHPLQNSFKRLRRHPRMGSIIFVTPNPTLRFGVGLLAQFLGAQFFVVETFQQIMPILKKLQSD